MSEKQTLDELKNEDDLRKELEGALVILTTTSPDKRNIFSTLFSQLGYDPAKQESGVNFYFTHSGHLRIPPVNTAEKTGDYNGNLHGKAYVQCLTLQQHEQIIRAQLKSNAFNAFDPATVKLVGMTEDSGWEMTFDHIEDAGERQQVRQAFMDCVKKQLTQRLRPRDAKWLLKNIDDESSKFPGPNLKPLQEHLKGGLDEMMNIIYDAADQAGLKQIRYLSHSEISFVIPHRQAVFTREFESTGRLLTRQEYNHRLRNLNSGRVINSPFVHVPDGLSGNDTEVQTVSDLRDRFLVHTSKEFPGAYERRECAEWLQKRIGKGKVTAAQKSRPVNIAFTSPETFEGLKDQIRVKIPLINDYAIVGIPNKQSLLKTPDAKHFGNADVIVLVPQKPPFNGWNLRVDPNLSLATNFAVTMATDPESMSAPVILDNRKGHFDETIRILSDAFIQGRMIGDFPFHIVNTDQEMQELLRTFKHIHQSSPLVEEDEKIRKEVTKATHKNINGADEQEKDVAPVPKDGILSVFVAGGHSNNNRDDVLQAYQVGYMLAAKNIRIVTGGGQIEGSMGAVYTGFIQYHLDKIGAVFDPDIAIAHDRHPAMQEAANYLKEHGAKYFDNQTGRYRAEDIIQNEPDILEKLSEMEEAGRKAIPRNMFYAYSTAPLVEMESPTRQRPPATTFQFTGTRERRKQGLYSPGRKIFLPGSIGTDEELNDVLRQHLDVRMGKPNATPITDGTVPGQEKIVIYNPDGRLDKLLAHYNLLGDEHPVTRSLCKEYNITIANTFEELAKCINSPDMVISDAQADIRMQSAARAM